MITFLGKSKIAQTFEFDIKNKINYTQNNNVKILNKDIFEKMTDTNKKKIIQDKLNLRINNIIYDNIDEPVYKNFESCFDEDNISIEITNFFDEADILRKIVKKDRYSNYPLSIELFNQNGFRQYTALTDSTSNDNIIIKKFLFSGDKKSYVTKKESIKLDLKQEEQN